MPAIPESIWSTNVDPRYLGFLPDSLIGFRRPRADIDSFKFSMF
jgi:hypothetical protein